jgi:hypothetical protein
VPDVEATELYGFAGLLGSEGLFRLGSLWDDYSEVFLTKKVLVVVRRLE